jgi:replication factor A1
MKISELFVRQGGVEVEGTIKELNEPRIFNKFGKELKVADAILEDDSGAIKLTLWNEDIEKIKAGDKVRISKGYVNEYQGEKQLTSGKFGKIEKIGKDEKAKNDKSSKEDAAELDEIEELEEMDPAEDY